MNGDQIDKARPYFHSAENYANASDMQELYLREQNNNINGELQDQQPSQNTQYSATQLHQFRKKSHTHHHNAPSSSSSVIDAIQNKLIKTPLYNTSGRCLNTACPNFTMI